MGRVYIIRSDFLQTGKLEEVSVRWTELLPEREKLSPLAAAFANPAGAFESGILNEFIHIWPYSDLNHWAEVREKEARIPGWHESLNSYTVSQTGEVWLPVPYSPMH